MGIAAQHLVRPAQSVYCDLCVLCVQLNAHKRPAGAPADEPNRAGAKSESSTVSPGPELARMQGVISSGGNVAKCASEKGEVLTAHTEVRFRNDRPSSVHSRTASYL